MPEDEQSKELRQEQVKSQLSAFEQSLAQPTLSEDQLQKIETQVAEFEIEKNDFDTDVVAQIEAISDEIARKREQIEQDKNVLPYEESEQKDIFDAIRVEIKQFERDVLTAEVSERKTLTTRLIDLKEKLEEIQTTQANVIRQNPILGETSILLSQKLDKAQESILRFPVQEATPASIDLSAQIQDFDKTLLEAEAKLSGGATFTPTNLEISDLEDKISDFKVIVIDYLQNQPDLSLRVQATELRKNQLAKAESLLESFKHKSSQDKLQELFTKNPTLEAVRNEMERDVDAMSLDDLADSLRTLTENAERAQRNYDALVDPPKEVTTMVTGIEKRLKLLTNRFIMALEADLNANPNNYPEIAGFMDALTDAQAAVAAGGGELMVLEQQIEALSLIAINNLIPAIGGSVTGEAQRQFEELIRKNYLQPALAEADRLRLLDVSSEVTEVSNLSSRIKNINLITHQDPSLPGSPVLTRQELFDLKAEFTRAEQAVLNYVDTEEPSDTAKSLSREMSKAEAKLTKLLELKKPEAMNLQEVADDIISVSNLDIFEWSKWKTADPSRNKDLFNRFMALAFTELDNPDEDLQRIVDKVRVQINTLDNKLLYETGVASVDRSQLQDQLKNRQIARNEVMEAATHHPEWGSEVRHLLRHAIEKAALRKDEVGYDFGLAYERLSGENGRAMLEAGLEAEKERQGFSDMAVFMASKLFTSFDMLTISLQQRQKKTQTRGHNGGIDDIDRVLLQDPLASFIHRSQRYGGDKKDWAGWWLLYVEDIHHHDPGYGSKGDTDGADILHESQHMARLYEDVYYDVNKFAGKIPLMGFCESLFPDTYNMVTMAPNEVLRVKDKMVDANGTEVLQFVGNEVRDMGGVLVAIIDNGVVRDASGNSLGTLDDAKITVNGVRYSLKDTDVTMNFYQIAEGGWNEILQFAFKSMEHNLTKTQIMEEAKEGGKGGLLNTWLRLAGEAKMFPGNHLRYSLEPMLTHFILRIFSNYVGTTLEAREELFHEVIGALKLSQDGGLKDYKNELQKVIDNISGSPGDDFHGMSRSLVPYENYREKQLVKYVNEWWHEEKKGIPVPSRIKRVFRGFASTVENSYYLMIERKRQIHAPFNSTGLMLQVKEGAKK